MCFLFLLVSLPNFTIKIPIVLLFTLHITKNIAHHITEVTIFYADKLMVMDSSKNSCVFNFTIVPKLQKSRKFDACKIYMFYSMSISTLCQNFSPIQLLGHRIFNAAVATLAMFKSVPGTCWDVG